MLFSSFFKEKKADSRTLLFLHHNKHTPFRIPWSSNSRKDLILVSSLWLLYFYSVSTSGCSIFCLCYVCVMFVRARLLLRAAAPYSLSLHPSARLGRPRSLRWDSPHPSFPPSMFPAAREHQLFAALGAFLASPPSSVCFELQCKSSFISLLQMSHFRVFCSCLCLALGRRSSTCSQGSQPAVCSVEHSAHQGLASLMP